MVIIFIMVITHNPLEHSYPYLYELQIWTFNIHIKDIHSNKNSANDIILFLLFVSPGRTKSYFL